MLLDLDLKGLFVFHLTTTPVRSTCFERQAMRTARCAYPTGHLPKIQGFDHEISHQLSLLFGQLSFVLPRRLFLGWSTMFRRVRPKLPSLQDGQATGLSMFTTLQDPQAPSTPQALRWQVHSRP